MVLRTAWVIEFGNLEVKHHQNSLLEKLEPFGWNVR
jgi:hypothetical protein